MNDGLAVFHLAYRRRHVVCFDPTASRMIGPFEGEAAAGVEYATAGDIVPS